MSLEQRKVILILLQFEMLWISTRMNVNTVFQVMRDISFRSHVLIFTEVLIESVCVCERERERERETNCTVKVIVLNPMN